MRLQKKKSAALLHEDYDDEPSLGEQVAKSDGLPKKGKTKKKEIEKKSDLSLLDNEQDLENFVFADGDTEIESVKRDTSGLSKEEKLELILTDSPELFELFEEFKTSISEIRNKTQPILERIQDDQLVTEKGVSYLETKNRIVVSSLLIDRSPLELLHPHHLLHVAQISREIHQRSSCD